MSYSNPLPPMPGRPLAYWLDSDMARTAPQTSTSALRDMAWIYGQWRGLAGAATGLGIALLGGGLLALSTMTSAIALWLSLILAGLALLATSILIRVLKLPRIPRSQRPMASRAPQKIQLRSQSHPSRHLGCWPSHGLRNLRVAGTGSGPGILLCCRVSALRPWHNQFLCASGLLRRKCPAGLPPAHRSQRGHAERTGESVHDLARRTR